MDDDTAYSGHIRKLFHFEPADIAPLTNDLWKWCWRAPQVPTLRWLVPAKAHAVYTVLMGYASRREYSLSEESVITLDRYPTDRAEETIEPWLVQHDPDVRREVLLAYGGHPDHVYVVAWGDFCAHWDDFCYPGDDVIISPLTEDWVLYFYHEEEFFWGRPLRKATDHA